MTNYTYDSLDRLVNVLQPSPGMDGNGNPLPRPESQTRYDGLDNEIASTDARGNTTNYDYDKLDRLDRVQLPVPGGVADTDQTRPETRYDYDPSGNRLHEAFSLPQAATARRPANMMPETN